MTDAPPMTAADASRRRDLSLALTPWQLLLLVAGVFLLLRLLRGWRERWTRRAIDGRLSRRR
ncbi:MAG TPA: hypothetical protein VHK06_03960 [Candidatus Limnocylindria bacterium]|nr:hypothetical protein [Candidatus Limnocylindria bacterium]